MARRSRRRRDTETLSLAPLSASFASRSPRRSRPLAYSLGDWEDRREFHPEGYHRPARAFFKDAARSVLVTPSTPLVRKVSRTSFAYPKAVPICVRRQQRKEVLLALGYGGGGHRPGRRNFQSEVSCKR